eukprot:jgi/Psemu1/300390/fgenesh1_kg.11_\
MEQSDIENMQLRGRTFSLVLGTNNLPTVVVLCSHSPGENTSHHVTSSDKLLLG